MGSRATDPLFFRGDFVRYSEKGTPIPLEWISGTFIWGDNHRRWAQLCQYLHTNKNGTARVLLRGFCLPDRVVDSAQYPAVFADIPLDDIVLYKRHKDNRLLA